MTPVERAIAGIAVAECIGIALIYLARRLDHAHAERRLREYRDHTAPMGTTTTSESDGW